MFSKPTGTRPRLEALEDRTLPTATLFLDFGDAFPAGGLNLTVQQLYGDLANGGIQGPDLRGEPGYTDTTPLSLNPFNPLVTFDYNRDGAVNGLDATALKADIVQLVRRSYEPLNINVQVVASSSLAAIRATLQANNGLAIGKNDSYTLIGSVRRTDTNVSLGQGLNLYGLASGLDIALGNQHDNAELVFADRLLPDFANASAAAALAYTAAHEPAHGFGLEHSDPGQPGSDADLLAGSELVLSSASFAHRQQINFFTRFDLPTESGAPPMDPFETLLNDPDIGPRPGFASYVTGTGAFDRITLTRQDSTHATVLVQAYRDARFTKLIASRTYSIASTNGILVDTGAGDDQVVIDATLGVTVTVRGMSGNDQVVVQGNGVASGSYLPRGTIRTGLDGKLDYGGTLVAGKTTIVFSEFLAGGSVVVNNISQFTMTTPNSSDNATIDIPTAGSSRIAGTSAGVAWVPLLFSGVGNVILDTGAKDGTSPDDRVTVNGLAATGLTRFTLKTGQGNDALSVASNSPAAVVFDGGAGTNTLTGPNSASTWTITGVNTGTLNGNLSFTNVANLVGGSADDVFCLQTGGSLAGSINGGGGENWLDYSRYSSRVLVDLVSRTASQVRGGIQNIRHVNGSSTGGDILIGSAQGSILVGHGAGNSLLAGAGRSLLIGGFGNNTLIGKGGDDLLIAGQTSYDANLPALLALFAQWGSGDSYSLRITKLRGGAYPLVLNKTVFLPTAGRLSGTGGQDWFWAGLRSSITDLQSGEQVN